MTLIRAALNSKWHLVKHVLISPSKTWVCEEFTDMPLLTNLLDRRLSFSIVCRRNDVTNLYIIMNLIKQGYAAHRVLYNENAVVGPALAGAVGLQTHCKNIATAERRAAAQYWSGPEGVFWEGGIRHNEGVQVGLLDQLLFVSHWGNEKRQELCRAHLVRSPWRFLAPDDKEVRRGASRVGIMLSAHQASQSICQVALRVLRAMHRGIVCHIDQYSTSSIIYFQKDQRVGLRVPPKICYQSMQ